MSLCSSGLRLSSNAPQRLPAARCLPAPRLLARPARKQNTPCQAQQSHQGHAVLHDFCMTLPYSAAMVVAGAATAVFGTTQLGLQLLGAGAAVGASSYLSLQSWRTGGASTLQTLASAAAAGWVAYTGWQQAAGGANVWAWGALTVLSAAAALFCVYNVAAGGNPPKSRPQ